MSEELREKVINGLEYCIDYAQRVKDALKEVPCEGCPYRELKPRQVGEHDCIDTLFGDALAMLKAQEPVKPLDENYWKHTMGRCGHCKAPLPAIEGLRSKFCWMCGKAVKWDD